MSRDPHAEPNHLEDDLAAYALGALNDDEAVGLEAHIADCAACQGRLRWLRPAVDVLPAAVAQRTPPPRLRENVPRPPKESRDWSHRRDHQLPCGSSRGTGTAESVSPAGIDTAPRGGPPTWGSGAPRPFLRRRRLRLMRRPPGHRRGA